MTPGVLGQLQEELRLELARIAGWWTEYAHDADGRLYGEVGLDGIPVEDTPVSLVLQSRVLWFFSEYAARTGQAKEQARQAFEALRDRFVDARHGGMFWAVARCGGVTSDRKQGYGQAFALYAISAYARMSGDAEAKALAKSQFKVVQRFRDTEQGGYFEAFARDWSEIGDIRLSEKDAPSVKTMNTHLHVLEALTEYLRLSPKPEIRSALKDVLEVHLGWLFDPRRQTLRMFLSRDWQDESEVASFGHDIEASWLLMEAAEVLGDRWLLAKTREVSLMLARQVLAGGVGTDGGVFNEKRLADRRLDGMRIWWVQAEALVGFLKAHAISGDAEFLAAAVRVWEFIKAEVIDPDGEWRWYAAGDGQVSPYRSGPWKACYHNGRALMEAEAHLSRLLVEAT